MLVIASVVFQAITFVERRALEFRHRSGGPEKRYILETMGSGVALFDYDSDSDPDVYLVNAGSIEPLSGETNRLFRNEGGFRFVDVTAESGLSESGFGQGVAVGDVDNDGDADVYVTNFGPNALYLNNGDGTFREVDASVADARWSTSAAFADVDNDGFLDLYVCNYLDFDRELLDSLVPRRFCEWKGLAVNCGPRGFPKVSGALYRNRGDGTFQDVTAPSGVERIDGYQLGVVFSDLDLDGDPDLYVATDSTLNFLFENRGDGTFADRSIFSGAAFSGTGAEQAGMGVDSGDVDGDSRPDLFVSNFSDDYNTLYANRGGLTFHDVTDVAGLATSSLPYLGWSTFIEDLDADGDLDLLVVNGHVYPQVDGAAVGESFRQPMQLFLNDGTGRFTETKVALPSEALTARGAALGDLDSDADVDVVVNAMDDQPLVLESSSPPLVSLTLVGRRSNRDGIGAKVWTGSAGPRRLREVLAGRGYLSSSEPVARFVSGDAELWWPSGERESLAKLEPGRYVVVEGSGRAVRLP